MRNKLSLLSLVLVNLYPIFGVVFLSWRIADILILYWAENIAIGFYNVLKMLIAKKENLGGVEAYILGKRKVYKGKYAHILFFIVHYGGFTFVHGLFVFEMFAKNFYPIASLYLGMMFLFISHGISYLLNYVGKKEYENVSPEGLMLAPYGRVVIMHLTILLGGFLIVTSGGQSLGPLIILTLLKTIIDLASHSLEHNKYIPDLDKNSRVNKPTKVYHVNPKFIKMFFPGYAKFLAGIYKKSVETGKWEEMKKQLDPNFVAYTEDYWFKNFGISSKNDLQ